MWTVGGIKGNIPVNVELWDASGDHQYVQSLFYLTYDRDISADKLCVHVCFVLCVILC
jgi:hypothetical protein